jgi:hypothetical protein
MNLKTIAVVREEMARLSVRITELEEAIVFEDERRTANNKRHGLTETRLSTLRDFPLNTGAVKRASMDLTRALANLRRCEA